MTTAGNGDNRTGPRPAAPLIALEGIAPDPAVHVIFRSTRHDDGSVTEGYLVPGEPQPFDAGTLDTWLNDRLPAIDRLAVAVLVIRETLNPSGMLLQCTIERRRGSADGPYCGDPVRVEFAGAATAVHLYRSHPDGGLTEITPSAAGIAAPRVRSATQFAGEHRALQSRFGPTAAILDSREPTLFEDMVGLSSIVHVRTPDGRTIGCGIGWFGDLSFVLEAAFPRFSAPPELTDGDEAAVDAILRDNNLIRGETRRDDTGIAVTARQRGSGALYLVRPTVNGAQVEPHVPSREAAGPDQQRWIHYIETYEGLTVLDVWPDGTSNAVIALTGDLSGQIWRHRIDIDGVETWRQAGSEAALGALHREHLFPTLANGDAAPEAAGATPPPFPAAVAPGAEGSLLSRAENCARALAAARSVRGSEPAALARQLADLLAATESLGAHVTASAARALHSLYDPNLASALEPMLRQELDALHCIVLAPARLNPIRINEPPFGARVASAFPSAGYDIAEAAMCLALRRPTACMFHCMRVIECAISAFARCIGVDGPLDRGERRWDAILHALHSDGDTNLALSQLQAVSRCWHGPTLVPDQKYTEEEAERIFTSVGTLMRTMSELCDESGARSSQQT